MYRSPSSSMEFPLRGCLSRERSLIRGKYPPGSLNRSRGSWRASRRISGENLEDRERLGKKQLRSTGVGKLPICPVKLPSMFTGSLRSSTSVSPALLSESQGNFRSRKSSSLSREDTSFGVHRSAFRPLHGYSSSDSWRIGASITRRYNTDGTCTESAAISVTSRARVSKTIEYYRGVKNSGAIRQGRDRAKESASNALLWAIFVEV